MRDPMEETLEMTAQEKLFYRGVCPSLQAMVPKREPGVGTAWAATATWQAMRAELEVRGVCSSMLW